MMSHVCYPHLDAALRAAEEDLQSSGEGEDRQDFVLGCTRVIPASLSPFMNRVLLRRRLGFRGITVTDWGQMGAIRSFVGDLTNFPADMHLLEPFSRLIICSVEAGNNFLLGCSECVDAHQVPPKIVEQVKQWAGTHPRWRQQLETLTLESFEWLRSKVLETDDPKPSLALPHETIALLIDPTSLHSLSVHDLVAFHLGYHIPNDRLQLIQSCIDTNNFDDVCQRGIVLVALFRYYYCKSLLQESDASVLTEPERSLLDFLCRPQCDPRQCHGENPQEWLQTVQQHPWYIAFCNTVDWGELDRRTDVVGDLGSGELLRELEERAIAEAQRRLGSMERTAPKFF